MTDDMGGSYFSFKAIFITLIVLATVICISIFAKGMFNLMPILFAIIIGYIVCIPLGLVDIEPVRQASLFSFMDKGIMEQVLLMPSFKLDAILAIAPISLVTIIEHVGDITTNSAVVGKDFMKDPGVHRTLLGDGIATSFAGL